MTGRSNTTVVQYTIWLRTPGMSIRLRWSVLDTSVCYSQPNSNRCQGSWTRRCCDIAVQLEMSRNSGLLISWLRPRPHECVFKSLRFHFTPTRPHDTDTVALSNPSTLEIVIESLRLHRKRNIVFNVFVWTGHENATKCLRFQMKTHPGCGVLKCRHMCNTDTGRVRSTNGETPSEHSHSNHGDMVAWRTMIFVSYGRFSPSVNRTRPDSRNVQMSQMGCTGQQWVAVSQTYPLQMIVPLFPFLHVDTNININLEITTFC